MTLPPRSDAELAQLEVLRLTSIDRVSVALLLNRYGLDLDPDLAR